MLGITTRRTGRVRDPGKEPFVAHETQDEPGNPQLMSVAWLRSQPSVLSQILEISKPYYIDARPLIDEQVAESTDVYLSFDSTPEHKLAGFFFIRWTELPKSMGGGPGCYGGLALARQDLQRQGVTTTMLRQWREDVLASPLGARTTLWAFTALPSLFDLARRMFRNVVPAIDGTLAPEASRRLFDLRQAEYPSCRPSPLPFALLGISPVRYSPGAGHDLLSAGSTQAKQLFKLARIKEHDGDRILMLFAP